MGREAIRMLTFVLVALVMVSSTSSLASLSVAIAESRPLYEVFAEKRYPGIVPILVFNDYLIGLKKVGDSSEIVAVNLYSDDIKYLGSADSYGLNTSSLKFWKSANYFALYDGRVALVWDAELRQVGRFAADDLRSIVLQPNGYLVAWSSETVAVFEKPRFVYGKQYDVWEAVFRWMKTSNPRDLVKLEYDVEKIESEIVDELLKYVASRNGTVISGPRISYRFDLAGETPSQLREKLRVIVVSAGVVNDVLYVAANFNVTVIAEGHVVYSTRSGNSTAVNEYTVVRRYPVTLGALFEVGEGGATPRKFFVRIEAGAASNLLAFVYEPLLNESLDRHRMMLITPNGTMLTIPIHISSRVEAMYLVDGFEVVESAKGTVVVYRSTDLVYAFRARRVVDLGTSPGGIYVAYENERGVLELGVIDLYSGRYAKYVLETPTGIVGLHIDDEVLFCVLREGDGARVLLATRKPLATVYAIVTDPYGNAVHDVLRISVCVRHGRLVVNETFRQNPIVVKTLVPATVRFRIEVPYGGGEHVLNVTESGTYRVGLPVHRVVAPGSPGTTASVLFYNPFFREYVVIRDIDTLKYRLPGATSLDAYGSMVAILTPQRFVEMYRVDGTKLWSTYIPKPVDSVRIFYPYVVAYGDYAIYLLSAPTGNILAELDMKSFGYDIDLSKDYLVAWNDRTLAIHDIRRSATIYLDMSRYGTVQAACVVDGIVYVYMDNGNVYVLNPATKGIIDVVPFYEGTVVSYATDGVFHAVSVLTRDGYKTIVVSSENGVVTINDGPVAYVKTLGRVVNAPVTEGLRGNLFAVLAVRRGNVARIYVVGMNALLVTTINTLSSDSMLSFATNFMAETVVIPNATATITLRDYSGTPRVTIITSIPPTLLAVSENLVAYGDAEKVYVIPNPRVIGKYKIEVMVVNEKGEPIDADVHIVEYGITARAKDGRFAVYLSVPGTYHIVASTRFYKPGVAIVTVSDESPTAVATIRLEPMMFRLEVRVLERHLNQQIAEGLLTIRGVDVRFSKTINLSREKAVVYVRPGTYEVSFVANRYTSVSTTVRVHENVTVTLVTNKTKSWLAVRVLDEEGSPIANATVRIAIGRRVIETQTNVEGIARALVPVNATGNVTIVAVGFVPTTKRFNITYEDLELRVVLQRIVCTLTIIAQQEDGKPVTATVQVFDSEGNLVKTLTVTQSATIELPPGAYTIEGRTEDGRKASTSVILTYESPSATVTLTFPNPPTPIYVALAPYVLAITLAISVAVVVMKKVRRPKPTIEKVT